MYKSLENLPCFEKYIRLKDIYIYKMLLFVAWRDVRVFKKQMLFKSRYAFKYQNKLLYK